MHRANTPRSGSCSRRIGEAKDAGEAALVQALVALGHPPKSWAVWLHQWRENPREPCSDSENRIQGTLAGGSVGFTKREAGVVRVTCTITQLSLWSRTPSAQASALVLVSSNRRRCGGPYVATAVLQDLNP